MGGFLFLRGSLGLLSACGFLLALLGLATAFFLLELVERDKITCYLIAVLVTELGAPRTKSDVGSVPWTIRLLGGWTSCVLRRLIFQAIRVLGFLLFSWRAANILVFDARKVFASSLKVVIVRAIAVLVLGHGRLTLGSVFCSLLLLLLSRHLIDVLFSLLGLLV